MILLILLNYCGQPVIAVILLLFVTRIEMYTYVVLYYIIIDYCNQLSVHVNNI